VNRPIEHVIVLSGRSLFAEGVAARLGQQLGPQALVTINVHDTNALQQVIEAEPALVILDSTDEDVAQLCPLGALLNALPALKVVRLNPENDHIQVVTSQWRQAWQVRDLVELIKPVEEQL
jgi:DNA-binding NarL/FixJ family response regulator